MRWAAIGLLPAHGEVGKLKKLVFGLFARNFWLVLLEKNYLKFIPKSLRYRLYDYIITAIGVVQLELGRWLTGWIGCDSDALIRDPRQLHRLADGDG